MVLILIGANLWRENRLTRLQRGQNNKKHIMPLHFQLPIEEDTCLAVWHIEEDEAFFRSRAVPQREVSHLHKRLQHLAGRYLLRHLFPQFPTELIRIADTRKPFLEDEAYHFSISHCSDYAAAIVSRSLRVGVDIEVITEKAARIRHKFASEEEWSLVYERWATVNKKKEAPAVAAINNEDFLNSPPASPSEGDAVCATLIWSCKEAIFKWYGAGEVDFKEHIQITQCRSTGPGLVELEVVFKKEKPETLLVHSRQLNDLWLSYVAE